ncbi:DUF1275 family protein [Microbispora sp. ATCC PTA-5024]|uniref:DUF1275 family protein n=1 Tax=Microbispora sp. ATCC PTA-5024 TaxID=316330 RepID=UPI000A0262EE|nr:YoaK family protein [Microbispora sp. ATCC PTA-5024]
MGTAATPRPTDAWRMVMATALTMAAGATNAIGFVLLGGVFASVMTGNLVVLGLAAAEPDPMLAARAGAAFAGFVLGVAAGARAMGSLAAGRPQWRERLALVLAGETVLLVAVLAVSSAAGGRPGEILRLGMVAAASLAMGVQSGASRTFGIPGLSTTFFTGTLTGVLTGLVSEGVVRLHSVVLLAGLAAGAAAAGWLAFHAPAAAPVLPVALVAAALTVVAAREAPVGAGH